MPSPIPHKAVKDVMTRQVHSVLKSASFREIVSLIELHRVSALPVVDIGGHVLGVVSEADLLLKEERVDLEDDKGFFEGKRHRLERRKSAATSARDLMTAPAITITQTASIAEAARLMHQHGIKRLPVVNEGGQLLGIVSRSDLLKVFLRDDDEIARELLDGLLTRFPRLVPDDLKVEALDGVVTLTGLLPKQSDIEILVGLVMALDGVVDVRNQLRHEAIPERAALTR